METPAQTHPAPAWSHFHHQADIGVRGIGNTPAEAFEQAALALTAVITDPARVVPGQCIPIECQAADLDFLLLDWLNELIFQMATRRMLFSRFSVRIEAGRLSAEACGEPIDIARHHPTVEIKGATLTELKVEQLADGRWLAQCVVDV